MTNIAYEYLEAIGIKELFEKQLNDILFNLACETTEGNVDELKRLKEVLVWDNIAPVLANTLTEEIPENVLKDVVAFYKTDSGIYLKENLLSLTKSLQEDLNEFLKEKLDGIV